MRIRDDHKPERSPNRTPYKGVVPLSAWPDKYHERLREQNGMAQRLYRGNPMHSSPWWSGYKDGYPTRVAHHRGTYGINVMESGEIELKSPCGGSPSDCATRGLLHMMTSNTLEVLPWGQRPVMYTEDGHKLTKRDYRPLRRYCLPHQPDRDATQANPTVLIDHELSVAAPLLPGENGMWAYWPDERSYPTTWSSWLVTIENEEVCKIMAAALRRVCKYASAINAMMKGQQPATAQAAAASKEADRMLVEWKTAGHMLRYLAKSHDPKEIAKMIMDEWSSRQVLVLAAALSQRRLYGQAAITTATWGYPARVQFTTTSGLWQMLREQTSEQYETKFLYTKPPEYRSNWQLVTPPME